MVVLGLSSSLHHLPRNGIVRVCNDRVELRFAPGLEVEFVDRDLGKYMSLLRGV
jgi:hypothetical protein